METVRTRAAAQNKRKSTDLEETPTSPTRSPTAKQNKTRAGDVTGTTINESTKSVDHDAWLSLGDLHRSIHSANSEILKSLQETVGKGNRFNDEVASNVVQLASKERPTTRGILSKSTPSKKTKCNKCSNLVDEAYTLADWNATAGVTSALPKKIKEIPKADQVSSIKIFGLVPITQVLAATIDGITPLELGAFKIVNIFGKEYPFGIGKTHPTCDDVTFAQQRLTGPNPMHLEKVTTINALKKKLEVAELTKSDFDDIVQASEAMIKTGKTIYVLDYLFLKKFVNTKNDQNGQIPATFAVFTFDGTALAPLRIAVVGPNNLRRKAAPGDNAWQFAKRCVQCSDVNVHEIKYHLNDTHLMTELILVATKRILAPANHFIDFLLAPHFRITLSLNDGARTTLLPALTKMCGTDLATIEELVGLSFAAYDFVGSYPRNDLKKRGFMKKDEVEIEDFYYAKDAIRLWDMLHKFFEAVVEAEYPNKSLEGDLVLKCWQKYIQEDGGMKTFPDLNKPKDLVDALTNIVFSATVQHAAVNYEQAHYFGYVENAPLAIYNWNKLDWNNVNEKKMNDMDSGRRLMQREFVKMLSQPPDTDQTLLYIVENHYTKYDAPRDVLLEELEKFSRDVRKRKGDDDYVVLNPDSRNSTLAAGIYI